MLYNIIRGLHALPPARLPRSLPQLLSPLLQHRLLLEMRHSLGLFFGHTLYISLKGGGSSRPVVNACGPKVLYRDIVPSTVRDKSPIYLPTICDHDSSLRITDDSKEEAAMKMFSKLLSNEKTNAAAVLALSATVIALVAKGAGPVSPKKVVSRVLSNPVPRLEPTITHGTDASVRGATHLRTAA